MSTVTTDVGHPLTNSGLTDNYIGSETFLQRRDIFNQIYDTYRENEGLADMLISLGKKKKTDNTTFHHWEDDWLISEGEIDSISIPAAVNPGDSAVVVLTAGSHQEGGSLSPFMKGDLVKVNGVNCQVTAVDKGNSGAHELTITPVLATGVLSTLAGGELVNWYGTAFADGTTQPGSVVRKPTRFENDTQILKTQFETHGSEAANLSEVEINGKPYYYHKGIKDALTRQMIAVNYTLLLGERADNLTDATAPDGSATVYTTEGLERTIDTRGITQTYTNWDYSEIEDMTRNLDAERVAEEYCGMLGTEHHLAHESALFDKNVNTGIRYTMFDTKTAKGMVRGDEGRSVSFGFDSYRSGGRTFHVKKWDALNYQPITGFTGNPYSDMGLWMPMKAYKDAKTEKGLYSVMLRYKSNDMENRFMKEWKRGRDVTNKDAFEWNHQSELGLQLGLVNGYTKSAK